MKKVLALAVLMGIAVLPAFAQQEIEARIAGFFESGSEREPDREDDSIRHGADCDQTAGCGDQSVELGALRTVCADRSAEARMNGKGSADVTLYYDSLSSVKVSGANVSVAGVLSAVMLDMTCRPERLSAPSLRRKTPI